MRLAICVTRWGNFLSRYYFRSEYPDLILFLTSLFALLAFVFCSYFFLCPLFLKNDKFIITFHITIIRFVKNKADFRNKSFCDILHKRRPTFLRYLSHLRIAFTCIIAPFPHFNLDECRQMSKYMGWDCLESPANILESPTAASLWCPALSPLP